MLGNQGQAAVAPVNLANIAAQTATFNGDAAWVDVRAAEGDIVIFQEVGAVTGTTPSLAGKIQDATDGAGTGAADVTGATFTAVTAANNRQKITIPAGSVRGWIRYTGTITGTTPSFTMGVCATYHPKYTT